MREVTRGSPALLRLYAALRRGGEAPAALLRQLADAPSIELLLGRIWQRLDAVDRQFLYEFSTFCGAAPRDAWTQPDDRIARLAGLELVREDGRGGLSAPQYALPFLRQRAPAELRVALHLFAANARETRAEITEAAYHLLQAGQPSAAVWLWVNHMAQEQAVLAQIGALEFQGEVDEDAQRFAATRERYAAALALAETVPFAARARWHARGSLGRVCWKLGELDASAAHLGEAIRMARAAGDVVSPLYHLINLTACHIQAGRHEDALAAASEGMGLAESLRHAYLIAGLSSNAGEACVRLGRLDEAERYAMIALRQEESAMQPYAATVLGTVQRARGQPVQAADSFRMAIAAAQDSQDAFAEAAARKELESVTRDS